MLILDSSIRSLQIALLAAVSVNELSLVAEWSDKNSQIGNVNTTVTNGTATVTLVPAPQPSVQRLINFISIQNKDTQRATVIIQYNDNATLRQLIVFTLWQNESLIYTDSEGWKAYTMYGEYKVSAKNSSSVQVLAQLNPGAASYTKFYTVPTGRVTDNSSMIICNQTDGNITFRIAIRVGGAADSVKDKLYYDQVLVKNTSFAFALGVTLKSTDEVWVYTDNANVSFNMFGKETY